ncbi:hypothetical protein K502DRAFT_342476 [Neoconidiobolus thromboides FSU 785]|nr:hypothetical protein K502DRAFT_342476 [Neoconidiobolus thromboides FSU 785]
MIIKPLFHLFLSFTLVNSIEIEVPDPCAVISKKPTVSYKDAISCLNKIELAPEIKNSVYDSIDKSLPFYAFIDSAKRSPEPNMPSYINIRAELATVVSKSYKSENEFHNSITKFFKSLYDGHLRYKSKCATLFEFKQPFPVFTEENQWGDVKVKVLENLNYPNELIQAWNSAGVDVTKYAGKEILAINGFQPLEYLQQYTREYVGISRDLNSRINFSTARVIQKGGKWGIYHGAFASTDIPPKNETINFTFRIDNQEKRVVVPYIALVPQQYNLSMDFMKNFCYRQPLLNEYQVGDIKLGYSEISDAKEVKIDQALNFEIVGAKEVNSNQVLNLGMVKEVNSIFSPLFDGIYLKSYLINDKVGVITIPDFGPENENLWNDEIRSVFQSLKDKKASRLILELSNNGGGKICLGYNILEYLFPNAEIKKFATDMHYNPLIADVAKYFRYPNYNFKDNSTQIDGSPINNADFFKETKTYTRGLNTSSKYTNLFLDNCFENPLLSLLNNNTQPFKTEDIIVLSNSVCYSTCCLLAYGLQEIHGVKSYSIGGLKNQQATVSSMAGGMVAPFELIEYGLKPSNLSNHPDVPKPFKTNSEFSFPIREAYSTKFNELRPLEFTWIPTSKRFPYNPNTTFNPFKVWEQVSLDAFGI